MISGGNLDINFFISGPQPVGIVVSTYKERDNFHHFEVETPGEYQICFDNSFSTLSEKIIFMAVYSDDDEDYFDDFENIEKETEDPEAFSLSLIRVSQFTCEVMQFYQSIRCAIMIILNLKFSSTH